MNNLVNMMIEIFMKEVVYSSLFHLFLYLRNLVKPLQDIPFIIYYIKIYDNIALAQDSYVNVQYEASIVCQSEMMS